LLLSLIKQLCCCRPDTPQAVEALRQYKEIGQHPDMKALEILLAATIHGFSKVYLVVDALDECGERKELLHSLRQIHEATSENLHMLCTSRRVDDIEAVLKPLLSAPGKTDISLRDHKDAIDADIGLYIDKNFASEDYRSWRDNIKEESRTELIQKSDGM
jgi:hypothetical protein